MDDFSDRHDMRLFRFDGRSLNKDEWWSVARRAKPSLTYEEFDRDWNAYWDEFDRRGGNAPN